MATFPIVSTNIWPREEIRIGKLENKFRFLDIDSAVNLLQKVRTSTSLYLETFSNTWVVLEINQGF